MKRYTHRLVNVLLIIPWVSACSEVAIQEQLLNESFDPIQVEKVTSFEKKEEKPHEILVALTDETAGIKSSEELIAHAQASEPASSEPESEEYLVEDRGLTTIGQYRRGNWYYKRQHLKDANVAYREIRRKVEQFEEIKKYTLERRASVDQLLGDFYLEIGLVQAELIELLNKNIEQLHQEYIERGDNKRENKIILAELEDKKKRAQAVAGDVAYLHELDASLDQAFSLLLEQTERARNAEQKAWGFYNEIAEVLDDKRSLALYHAIKAELDLVNALERYLTGEYRRYFEEVILLIQKTTQTVMTGTQDLKSRGIRLITKAQEEAEALERELQEKQKAEQLQKQQHNEEDLGFFTRVVAGVAAFFGLAWSGIKAPFTYVYHLFF